MEMAKFLVRHGVQIPDNINIVDSLMQRCPTKRVIKDFLLSIKKLENLQGDDFANASTPEVQEIWDARIAHLTHENITTEIAGVSSQAILIAIILNIYISVFTLILKNTLFL